MSEMDNLNTELERAHEQYRLALISMARVVCYQLATVARQQYPTSRYVVLDTSGQDYDGGQYVHSILDEAGQELTEQDDLDNDAFQDIPVSDLYDRNESQWKAFAVKPGADVHTSVTHLDIDKIIEAMEAE